MQNNAEKGEADIPVDKCSDEVEEARNKAFCAGDSGKN